MAGIQLSALVDTFLATSQNVLTGESFILNEKQRNNYFLSMVMKGYSMEEMLKGGDTITDQLVLDEDRTYGPYNPLTPKTPRLSNHLTEYTMSWCTSDAFVTFSKHEKGLNQAQDMKRGPRAMVFKNIIDAKWSNLMIDINNGMEREFFAQPVASSMETVSGNTTRVPYSIFASIHQFGAVAGAFPKATVNPGWTTIQGINPTTFTEWQNPVEFYAGGATALALANPAWDGFEAASAMYDRLSFGTLAIRPQWGETEVPKAVIICSRLGKKLWERAQRSANDYTRNGPFDAAQPGLNYNGVPLMWVEAMDKANVWPDGAGTGFAGENDDTLDEDGAATANPLVEGPRFVWIVPKYFKKYIHSEHFMEQETPPATPQDPYTRTIFFDCWHQNGNRSRKRSGGVMAPLTDIDGFN